MIRTSCYSNITKATDLQAVDLKSSQDFFPLGIKVTRHYLKNNGFKCLKFMVC